MFTGVRCGLIVGPEILGYLHRRCFWVRFQPERVGGVFVFGFFNNTFLRNCVSINDGQKSTHITRDEMD